MNRDSFCRSLDIRDLPTDVIEKLLYLAELFSCPKDVPLIPWLVEKGVIVEDTTGWRIDLAYRTAGTA
jgi:hypothetical protein